MSTIHIDFLKIGAPLDLCDSVEKRQKDDINPWIPQDPCVEISKCFAAFFPKGSQLLFQARVEIFSYSQASCENCVYRSEKPIENES